MEIPMVTIDNGKCRPNNEEIKTVVQATLK